MQIIFVDWHKPKSSYELYYPILVYGNDSWILNRLSGNYVTAAQMPFYRHAFGLRQEKATIKYTGRVMRRGQSHSWGTPWEGDNTKKSRLAEFKLTGYSQQDTSGQELSPIQREGLHSAAHGSTEPCIWPPSTVLSTWPLPQFSPLDPIHSSLAWP